MEVLTKQNIEKQELSIFIRDLSLDINTNVKHMIEDMVKSKLKDNERQHTKKKNHMKKKDIIIMEQNKKRLIKDVEGDMSLIDYYIQNMDRKDPFSFLNKLKTNEGRKEYKVRLLELFWENKKKYMKYIIILYYELKDINFNSKEEDRRKLIHKIEKLMNKCDVKLFMMEKMGNMLSPLDYWNNKDHVFDDWQKEVINYINNNQSIIVKAPTSAGKSFIAMSCGILHKKILYVCPAKPVAYQVGANFIKMGYKVHFLLDNISHFSYSQQTNIFIGTPKEIENNLMKIGNNFNFVVFDEIHNINKEDDGDIYENIIKLIPCNFLALSATIKNIDFLIEKMKEIHPKHKINYIEYSKRFMNHQRWLWKKDGLNKLHPLSVFQNIEDFSNNTDNNLAFTPNDCAILWNEIYNIFEDIDNEKDLLDDCSPDEYFTESRMLTLDDCRDYEIFIKKKLIEWSNNYPNEIQKIFNKLKDNPDEIKDNNIINLIREAKDRKMFPMLMFNTDESKCRNIFNNIYEYLSTKELEENPYHYNILEKKDELYNEYLKKREEHRSSIKITSTNADYEIKEKMEKFDQKQKSDFIDKIINYYQRKVSDIQNNNEISEHTRNIQERNLLKEMNQFIVNPDFSSQDIYSKHPDFIFTLSNEPMSADTIRNVRRDIKKTLGVKIPYDSSLFQMLKRGIGIYLENMPDEYNWQLQKLLSKKEIGVVISDKTLCLGIDLPVKTTCFLGIDKQDTFTKDEYLQMSGRAGRRGKDTQGNIIFFGELNYLDLMMSDLPNIEGNKKPIYSNYKALPSKYMRGNRVFENMINPERKSIEINNATMNEEGRKILWALRSYSNACYFILNLFTIEKELFRMNENNRELFLLKKVSSLIIDENYLETEKYYKMKKIDNIHLLYIFREYSDIFMKIYNNLKKDKYMYLLKVSKSLFNEINRMICSYII